MLAQVTIGWEMAVCFLVGAICTYVPMKNVINKLHRFLDDLREHNADGTTTPEEYTKEIEDIKEIAQSLGGLIGGIKLLVNKFKGTALIVSFFSLLFICGCYDSECILKVVDPNSGKVLNEEHLTLKKGMMNNSIGFLYIKTPAGLMLIMENMKYTADPNSAIAIGDMIESAGNAGANVTSGGASGIIKKVIKK